MLSEIFDWWARQMLDLLPGQMGRVAKTLSDALVLRVEDPGATANPHIDVSRRVKGVEATLGRFLLDHAGATSARAAIGQRRPDMVVLQIPPELLLERESVLPMAAEADLERVLGYEMDRITPFPASELFWTSRVERRDRARGRLHLIVSLVHKPTVAGFIERLADAGLAPDMLAVATQDGQVRQISLRRDKAVGARRRVTAMAAWACAVLALAVLATPFIQDSLAIAHTDARIDALRPRVAEVEALRRRYTADTSGADVFASEYARVGDTLQVLSALTAVLPDDTWLTALTLRQRVLTFTGQSARAARLIGTLSADPTFRTPTFAQPVTRADANGADLFSIRTELGL